MSQLTDTIRMVNDLVGNAYLYFDKPVSVRPIEFELPFNAWAVCVGPDGHLYIMDVGEQWYHVVEDVFSAAVISSIYLRIKEIHEARQPVHQSIK